MTDRYTYQVWFTDDANYLFRWAVRMNGELLTHRGLLRYTGSAISRGQATRKARRYIKRHRKYFGHRSPEYRV